MKSVPTSWRTDCLSIHGLVDEAVFQQRSTMLDLVDRWITVDESIKNDKLRKRRGQIQLFKMLKDLEYLLCTHASMYDKSIESGKWRYRDFVESMDKNSRLLHWSGKKGKNTAH